MLPNRHKNFMSGGCAAAVVNGSERAFELAMNDPDCRIIDSDSCIERQAEQLDPYNRAPLSRDIPTDSHLRWRDPPEPAVAMQQAMGYLRDDRAREADRS